MWIRQALSVVALLIEPMSAQQRDL